MAYKTLKGKVNYRGKIFTRTIYLHGPTGARCLFKGECILLEQTASGIWVERNAASLNESASAQEGPRLRIRDKALFWETLNDDEAQYATIIHELGHGAVCVFNNHSILSLYIRSGFGGGRIRIGYVDGSHPDNRSDEQIEAAVDVAGAVAQNLILGFKAGWAADRIWSSDRRDWFANVCSYTARPGMSVPVNSDTWYEMVTLLRDLGFETFEGDADLKQRAVDAVYEAWVAVTERVIRIQQIAEEIFRDNRKQFARNSGPTRRLNRKLSVPDFEKET